MKTLQYTARALLASIREATLRREAKQEWKKQVKSGVVHVTDWRKQYKEVL